MAPFPRGLHRVAILGLFGFALIVLSFFYPGKSIQRDIRNRALLVQQILSDKEPSTKGNRPTSFRLDLEEDECRAAFPLAFSDIEASVARGKFAFLKSNPDYKGLVQGRIRDGKLYIITAAPDTLPQILHQRTAILSQIHRALITSPSPLPDTHFAFCINDVPKNNTWAFSRPNKQSTYNTWLMPSFASWSWPKAHLGTMNDVLARIERIEKELQWDQKTDKLVWRGTPWFNPVGYPNLRKDLLKSAKGHDWADVAALDAGGGGEGGEGGNASTRINIEDFCRYKYVVYTEGVTYSGRLPYHQACGSVLITAPVTWLTTSALLLRPIDAEDLMVVTTNPKQARLVRPSARPRRRGVRSTAVLPTVASYLDANAIYVKPDFSNLEAVVQFLRSRPEVGRRVAQNQRDGVVRGAYLGAAAETCYWRALVRGWAAVAQVDEMEWREEREDRYETWLLNEVSDKRENTRGRIAG